MRTWEGRLIMWLVDKALAPHAQGPSFVGRVLWATRWTKMWEGSVGAWWGCGVHEYRLGIRLLQLWYPKEAPDIRKGIFLITHLKFNLDLTWEGNQTWSVGFFQSSLILFTTPKHVCCRRHWVSFQGDALGLASFWFFFFDVTCVFWYMISLLSWQGFNWQHFVSGWVGTGAMKLSTWSDSRNEEGWMSSLAHSGLVTTSSSAWSEAEHRHR